MCFKGIRGLSEEARGKLATYYIHYSPQSYMVDCLAGPEAPSSSDVQPGPFYYDYLSRLGRSHLRLLATKAASRPDFLSKPSYCGGQHCYASGLA